MISRLARLRAKKGFTMIEIIVVIAIIGILMAMVVPVITYDNRPTVGKGVAKDVFYKAQDVLADVEVAFPEAIASGKNVIFYAQINSAGNVIESGTAVKSGTGASRSVTPTAFAANIVPTDDASSMNKKMQTMFNLYVTKTDGMQGTVYVVVDDNYRVRAAYWTDAEPTESGMVFSDSKDYVLSNGYYCCSYPVSLSKAGDDMFPDFT